MGRAVGVSMLNALWRCGPMLLPCGATALVEGLWSSCTDHVQRSNLQHFWFIGQAAKNGAVTHFTRLVWFRSSTMTCSRSVGDCNHSRYKLPQHTTCQNMLRHFKSVCNDACTPQQSNRKRAISDVIIAKQEGDTKACVIAVQFVMCQCISVILSFLANCRFLLCKLKSATILTSVSNAVIESARTARHTSAPTNHTSRCSAFPVADW